MDFEQLLNKEQLRPVTDTEGAVLVLAGAGSGKTRVLTHRIAYLIVNNKVNPFNILAITFTNKAAREMKQRVDDIVGKNDVLISTFHSFCAKILRWEIHNLQGFNSNFSIYDDSDCERIISRILKQMDIDDKELKKIVRWHISNAKNHALDSKQYSTRIKGEKYDIIISQVYEEYERQLNENNALDFDDLLLKTLQLFSSNKQVLTKYQERFKYLLIDEFQDTNKIQYALVRLLASKHGNIFVVGDDDQSIYGWRWADVENIRDFKRSFVGARIYKLEQNYRSTSSILDLANKIIANNSQRMGKTLWTQGISGVKPIYNSCYNERAEADYVVGQINSLKAHHGYEYNDFAILVRANSITRNFEEKLMLYNFPYKVIGGKKFFERKEIKDFLAYLKILANESDNESILRIINTPKRGIGDGAIDKLSTSCRLNNYNLRQGILNLDKLDLPNALHKKISEFSDLLRDLLDNMSMPLDEFVRYCRRAINFESMYNIDVAEDANRVENIDELINSITEFSKDNPNCTLDEYLQSVSLISDNEQDVENAITVATVHGVKGLEFKCVFIVGLEEGIFPSLRCGEGEVQEERRIMYVAVTRARERLYLTNAQSRFRYGRTEYTLASRFLVEGDMIKKNANRDDDFDSPRQSNVDFSKISLPTINEIRQVKTNNNDISMFSMGMKVDHTRFGEGVIIEIMGENAKIKFEGLGIKTFNLRLAPLKVVK